MSSSSLQLGNKMVLLLVSMLWSVVCSQVVYMPRYLMRPPPVRRSAMEALERLRLPVARYFPQVESQAAPYQGPPVFSGYPEAYNVAPPQFVDEYAVQPEEEEYANYEYDFNPVYRPTQYGEEVYAQPAQPAEVMDDANTYNDLMDRYLLGETKEDMFDIERRSNNHENDTTTTTTTAPPSSTPQVQMTAVPSSPEKKGVKSLVVPDHIEERDGEQGQKEEPLFRPLQNSQRTFWNNQQHKSSIPMLQKIMQKGQKKSTVDPLLDELINLKKKPF